jgi:hypothetical protein
MSRGVLLTSNLPQLQNLIKRDPVAYKEEFLQQWNHYNSILQIFKLNPDEQPQRFRELVTFIAQVWIEHLHGVVKLSSVLAGRPMLSQGDRRVSSALVDPFTRHVRDACSRYKENARPEPRHAPEQGCHHVH